MGLFVERREYLLFMYIIHHLRYVKFEVFLIPVTGKEVIEEIEFNIKTLNSTQSFQIELFRLDIVS